jgi:hypothetical protein
LFIVGNSIFQWKYLWGVFRRVKFGEWIFFSLKNFMGNHMKMKVGDCSCEWVIPKVSRIDENFQSKQQKKDMNSYLADVSTKENRNLHSTLIINF